MYLLLLTFCPCPPCCAVEPCMPFATVCMVTPPPCLAPTSPQPVKPLQLPCPCKCQPEMSEEEAERTRYANFYNNYNIDWHSDPCANLVPATGANGNKCKGQTMDGKNPCCCEDYRRKKPSKCNDGCPTGFKPCVMKMCPPPGCHPCGVWCAEVQPCPPKIKKNVSKYEPGPCCRPCCKHWQPKEGPCKYDEPCKAHCFNHPPGMKPRAKAC